MMLDREMHKILVSHVLAVLEVLPETTEPTDFFQESAWNFDVPITDPEANRSIGWIVGVAEAHDVTILTLFDEEEIRLERAPKELPAGRRRLRRGR
jgi:hypothetical protein